MNWEVVLSVVLKLFKSLFIWFRNIHYGDAEIENFKEILKQEIHIEFEPENRDHLLFYFLCYPELHSHHQSKTVCERLLK